MNNIQTTRKTNFRWVICAMLFFATTVNYLDRQALSLTWKDFIAPEFHWTNTDYGNIAAAFSIMYAIANFFSGRIIDWLGTRRGYLWAIGVWSAGAWLHALCGWATEQWVGLDDAAQLVGAAGDVAATVSMVSVWFFLAARVVLAAGESGNFPAAVKVTAEYFPKKDRAFATAIFNAGATIGALVAPLCIPTLARYFKDMGVGNGWEMAFVVIGMLGFVWMGIWIFIYQPMQTNKRVNAAEREYILQDSQDDAAADADSGRKFSILECLRLRQTWAILMGKFLTDGVWWFFLFWTPAYISDVYGYTSDSTMAQMLMFTLYAITMLSLYGGKLPTIFINRTGGNAYNCRMKAMFIFVLAHHLHHRYRGRRPPVMVGQPLLCGQRPLPQEGCGHHHRHQRYGRRTQLVPHQLRLWPSARPCRGCPDRLLRFPGQGGWLLHHLLLLLCGLHRRLARHEAACAPLYARQGLTALHPQTIEAQSPIPKAGWGFGPFWWG